MIGIIGAMEIETRGIKKLMTDIITDNVGSIEFVSGKLKGKDVVCAMCNPGKVNAAICAQAMIMKYSPEIIINSGVAGSLCDDLNVLDIAIGKSCVQHDFDTTALGCPLGLVDGVDTINFECDSRAVEIFEQICIEENTKTGVIATGDIFVSGSELKTKLHTGFDAIACEMEGASIGHVCMVNNIKYAVLRAISDGADELDFNTFKVLASDKSIKIIEKFVEMY